MAVKNDTAFPPPPKVKTAAQMVTITPCMISKEVGTPFLLIF